MTQHDHDTSHSGSPHVPAGFEGLCASLDALGATDRAATPADLADRVFDAALRSQAPPRPVLARLGSGFGGRRRFAAAAAAAALCIVAVGLWQLAPRTTPAPSLHPVAAAVPGPGIPGSFLGGSFLGEEEILAVLGVRQSNTSLLSASGAGAILRQMDKIESFFVEDSVFTHRNSLVFEASLIEP